MALLVVLVVSTLGDRAVGQRPWRLDKAFAADLPPRRPHADRSQSRYIYPVPSILSAFPPVSFSFYLLPEALCLLVSTHPLKLSFEETSFRETVWTSAFTLAQIKSYHIHSPVSSLGSELDDRNMAHSRRPQIVEWLSKEMTEYLTVSQGRNRDTWQKVTPWRCNYPWNNSHRLWYVTINTCENPLHKYWPTTIRLSIT